jgi:transposase
MSGDIEFWRAHVEACRREGKAARGYARQHGLTLSSFYYWRKKLTPATALAGGSPGKFVALRVMEGTSGAAMVPCTLVLCSGLRLELAALPSASWLLALDLARAGAR